MEIIFEIPARASPDVVQSGMGTLAGEADPKGAVEAWEKLLKTNPEYPQKQQVEQYIAKAKEHAARG